MDPGERLERLEAVLSELVEEAGGVPILVEGIRDEEALRSLGVEGEVLVFNRIGSIIEVADRLRTRRRVILLLDWDRKGGHLVRLVKAQLSGQVELDLEYRRQLAQVSLVKCVEDLPHAQASLRKRVDRPRERLHDF